MLLILSLFLLNYFLGNFCLLLEILARKSTTELWIALEMGAHTCRLLLDIVTVVMCLAHGSGPDIYSHNLLM